jgi:iron transport multicopper oxidase
VLGIPYPAGAPIKAFATSIASGTRAAGIWAPGGIASDGTNLFVATGNTFGSNSWVGQEAIIRLQPGPSFSNQTVDYFAPHDWLDMDNGDVDIGGSGPVLVKNLVASLGKNGFVYLLDSANLGGVGTTAGSDGKYNAQVASGKFINAAATVTTSAGNTWLIAHAYQGANGSGCKKGSGDIVAMKISFNPVGASVEWCANSNTQGSPMITTSNDSGADAIVWFAGNHLNGWDVETGNQVYTGTDSLSNIERFTTPIAARGHIYVGADDKVYSFGL